MAGVARRGQWHRHRYPYLLPHRRRRDGAEIAGAAAGRAARLLDHAADAVDQERALSVRGDAERSRQPLAQGDRRQSSGSELRAVLHTRGTAADRPGERGARRAALGVQPDAAGALRVRRPHCRPGDGAAGADHRHPGRHQARRHSRDPRRPHAHAVSGVREGPRSHRRHGPHQGSAAAAAERRAASTRRRRARCRSCRKPRRSMPCSP